MHTRLLDLLRCPFCGGRLELVTSLFHRTSGDAIHDGVLGCECCNYPVVDGIPVMHLHETAARASAQIEAGDPSAALLTMVGVTDAGRQAQFAAAAASGTATYRDIVEGLGPDIEGGYFLYRFSDPTFVVAEAVVRAVAGTVLQGGGIALDVCGGSGHITRGLTRLASTTVLADLFFAKLWLARRFTAPGAIPVCCDGNTALPFARGAFDYAMCSDAFMFIWEKRQFVAELARAVAGRPRGTVLINHTHNQLVWSESHGQALTPAGYRNLFEGAVPRVFGESVLFTDVVADQALDLTRTETDASLDTEVALTLISSPVADVFSRHAIETPLATGGEWRINPLYDLDEQGDRVRATLRFPSTDYENEYGACRAYLPEELFIDTAALRSLAQGEVPDSLTDLIRRRVIVELPRQYL